MLPELGKWLFLLGCLLIIIGIFFWLGGKLPPWLSYIGQLPGDIRIQRPNFSFFFPLTTSILLSIILSLLLWLLRK